MSDQRFNHETGMEVLSSGVQQPTGHTVYSTQELFEDLLAHIDLPDILVYANASYVAECFRRFATNATCTRFNTVCVCTGEFVQTWYVGLF